MFYATEASSVIRLGSIGSFIMTTLLCGRYLRSDEPREFAESIGTVDDREAVGLRVAEHEVAV